MSTKRRIVAYCPQCEGRGTDSQLVPMQSGHEREDYLCVVCWCRLSLETVQELHDRYGGKYRGSDKAPKKRRNEYVATDGFKCTDGRIFGAYLRKTGEKLKHVRSPI